MRYVPVYRTLLTNALKNTWRHKGLWVFGFLATFAQTGAAANDLMRLAPKLEPGSFSWETLAQSWDGATYAKTLFAGLATGTTWEIVLSLGILLVVTTFFCVVILAAQHIVLHGLHRTTRRKKHLTAGELRKAVGLHHLGRLFTVNAVAKMLAISVILLGSLCMRSLLAQVPEIHYLVALAIYAVMLPVAFAVNAIAMHVLVHIVRDDMHLAAGVQHGVTFFSRHMLATLEFSAILFIVNYVGTLALLTMLWMLSQILVALFSATITSVVLLIALLLLTTLSILTIIVLIGGIMTTFNYSAWTEFTERFARVPTHPRTEHALHRLRYAFLR